MKKYLVLIGLVLLLAFGFGTLVSAENKIVWEYDSSGATSLDVAPNGNYLIMNGISAPVQEIDHNKNIVRSVTSHHGDNSAHYTNDGNLIITGKYWYINEEYWDGTINWSAHGYYDSSHNLNFFTAQNGYCVELPDGHFLISGEPEIVEFDSVSNTIANVTWSSPINGQHAQRLDNGNTLLITSDNSEVLEEKPDGTIVWSYTPPLTTPPTPPTTISDAHRLPSGNTLICDSNSVKEISPSGVVIWQYAEAANFAFRLANGNTAIANNTAVIEVQAVDTTPPGSITNLKNTTYAASYINWTWTDPTDPDFAGVMVYINGVWQTNVNKGAMYYNATGLLPTTSYTIATQTYDTSTNTNPTWVNSTAWTTAIPDTTPPVLNPVGSKSIEAGSQLQFVISGSDSNGNSLTYSTSALPNGAVFNPDSKIFTWTPDQTQIGSYNVTFTVSDGTLSSSETITIVVTDPYQWHSIGPAGATISDLAISPHFADDQTIVFGSGYPSSNFYRSSDGGLTWLNLSSFGAIDCVELPPDYQSGNIDQTIFLGGINPYISKNNGQTWTKVSLGNVGDPGTWDIAFSPGYSTDQTVFIAGNSGIFKSIDGGTTVVQKNVGFQYPATNAIAISPNYPIDHTLFAGNNNYGVYKSTDGGDSWIAMNNGLPKSYGYNGPSVNDIEISPDFVNDNTTYCAIAGKGIFKSLNGGQSWNLVITGQNIYLPPSIAFSPDYSNDRTIFLAVLDPSKGYKVIMSQDGGENWNDLAGLPPNTYQRIVVSSDFANDRRLFAGTSNGIWEVKVKHVPVFSPIGNKTINDGQPLAFSIKAVDPDNSVLSYSAVGLPAGATLNSVTGFFSWPLASKGTYNVIFRVSDGVYTDSESITITVTLSPPVAAFNSDKQSGTTPLTVTFTDTSTGNPTGWAWFFGDETYMMPWTQMTPSAGWSARYGQSSVVMPDGSIVLMGGVDNNWKNDTWRSTDNGATWTQVNPTARWTGRYLQSSVVMPDGSIVLMGGQDSASRRNDVWRSTDNGATWTQQTANAGWTARSGPSSVVMSDGSIVLMGGQDSASRRNDVWRSTDNGATWTQQTANAGWIGRYAFTSVVMPDGSIVLMGGSDARTGNGVNDVWRSTDNGATWTQQTANAGWTARIAPTSVAMPDGSIVLMGGYDIAGNEKNDVWRSTDNGATWTLVNESTGWSARHLQSSVVMPDGSIVLMGGYSNNGNTKKNDVWRLMPVGALVQNPSHTYRNPGIYQVSLQAYNTVGLNSIQKAGYITVAAKPPVASFTGTPTSGSVPLTVQFNDTSTNSPTSWTWTFGDGGTSTIQNSSHTYTNAGTYTVALTAANTGGSNVSTQAGFITVTVPSPVASFTGTPTSGTVPLTVQFNDTSINNPTSWAWTFGDGGTSTIQNSSHTYTNAGTYTVALTATNAGGSNTVTQTGYVTVTEPAPVASFTGTPTSGTAPLNVQFNDTSTNSPTSWSWTFGDGGTSTVQNPSHQYTSAGTYTVALTTTNAGGSNTVTQTGYITVTVPSPVASFTGKPTSGTVPLAVQFNDTSTNSPTSWSWTFGDGGTSNDQNPSHQYTNAGTYTVALTTTNAGGSNTGTQTGYIVVTVPSPVASFTGTPTSGTAPLTVQFNDTSTNNPTSWSWTFGDGGISVDQNPSHQYTTAGTYTVALTAANAGGSNTGTQTGYIVVTVPSPVASFTGTPTSGSIPLTVQFNDTSTNNPTSWSWTFGDGGTSTDQNSSHQYTSAGTYTVTLTTTNAGGSNTVTQTGYITVTVPSPVASFFGTPTSGSVPLTVQFNDSSTNSPTSWAWTFGDGGTSVDQNPSHQYTTAGTYTVALTAANAGGSNTGTQTGYIVVTVPSPVASFTGTPTSGTAPLTVQFDDTSTNNPTSWSWTFGDGGTSNDQNPSHQYSSAGTYTVALIATNAGGSNTGTQTGYITLTTPITAIGDINGVPQVDQILTAGTVSPSGATVTYQWQESNTGNDPWTNIGTPGSGTYVPVVSDVGMYIEVQATGTGTFSGTITSAPVGPIVASNIKAPLTPKPTINNPVYAGHTSVTGTAPAGATIALTVNNETPQTTTADGSTGAWTVDGLTLNTGDTLNVTSQLGSNLVSNPAKTTVKTPLTPKPTISNPVYAGDTSVTGKSVQAATIALTVNTGKAQTTTADGTTGVWTVDGLTLNAGDTINVTAQAGTNIESNQATTTVKTPLTQKPTINNPVYAGATSVTGQSVQGATIVLAINSETPQTTTADGTTGAWTVDGLTLNVGDTINVTAQAGTNTVSNPTTATAIVKTSVTSKPTINNPVYAGDTSVTGTAPAGATIVFTVNVETPQTTMADGTTGAWTVNGLTLAAGDTINVTAQVGTNPVSNPAKTTVKTPPTPKPTISNPVYAGAISVTGQSVQGAAISLTVNNGKAQTTTADGTTGAWTVNGLTLAAGDTINVTAQAGINTVSNPATTIVKTPPTPKPTINNPVNAGDTSLTGKSVQGATISLTVNNGKAQITTADGSTGAWTVNGLTLAAGDTINVTAQAGINTVSNPATATVKLPLTLKPTIKTPVYAGVNTVTGTAVPGANIALTVNIGKAQTTTADGSTGAWTVNGLTLATGDTINVTAQAGINTVSNPATATVKSR